MGKKICILGAANLKHMTLSSLYTDIFDANNQKYDLIYLDKYHIEEKSNAKNAYRFELNIKPEWPFFIKLLHYWKFRSFAINILDREKYDFIVVWNEFTAFMFSDYLVKKYPNKYSINIRDYNYNNVFFVQNRLKHVVEKSAFSTISSDRFRTFLPKYDYLMVHSYNHKVLTGLKQNGAKASGRAIRILFIGRLSYPDTMQLVIDALGGDSRYELYLIGTGCGSFNEYVRLKGFHNIYLHDSFEPSETANYLDKADVIYSLNKEGEIFSDVLLPIKLYYAIHLHVPILAFKTSYTYEYASNHDFAIGVSSDDIPELGDKIYREYQSIDFNKLSSGCDVAMEEIELSHKLFRDNVYRYIL